MGNLTGKIDFAVLFTVNGANPNGNPLDENRPRHDYDGYGEVSAECIKRKVRNRLQDMGGRIFVQSDERSDDGCRSLADRVKATAALNAPVKAKDRDAFAAAACEEWIDVRSFGQVFAFQTAKEVSTGVRGPVSMHMARSVSPIEIENIQITKSVNGDTKDKKSSDTMGMRYNVKHGLYVVKGSISHQLAERTGFSDDDAGLIKEALRTLFVNDSSSARPDGSMEVIKVYWWEHGCPNGLYSSAKVHRLLQVAPKTDNPKSIDDYDVTVGSLPGLSVQEIDGE